MRRTVAVLGQKGGTGKTTIAANIAAAAHLKGERVLLLDLDRQGSSFDWFAARADGSKLDGLNVVKADRELSLPKFRELARGYTFVVCDGAPRLGDVTVSAAVAANTVIVPLRAGPLDWWACKETLVLLKTADSLRSELKRPPVHRIFVLNAIPPNARITAHALEAITDGGKPAPTIGNRVAFPDAFFTGESVLTTAPTSPAAREIEALYRVVMEDQAA